MRKDNPNLLTLSGAMLAASGMLFLLIASRGSDSDDLSMLTRTLALSATLVPIIGLGIPDLIKLDISVSDKEHSVLLLKKYCILTFIAFLLVSMILYCLFIIDGLGVYQDIRLILLSLYISIATVIYNAVSSVLVSRLKYFSDLNVSGIHSLLRILLLISILYVDSNWIYSSLSWGLSATIASFVGLVRIPGLLLDSQAPNTVVHTSPVSLGLVSSLVNSRVRFLSFSIPIITSHLSPGNQAMAYILWTTFVGTLFIPNSYSTDMLVKMKNKVMKTMVGYYLRSIMISTLMVPAIYTFVKFLAIESSVDTTLNLVVPWAFLSSAILYEHVTKIRLQALDMKFHLISSSLLTIIFISAPIFLSSSVLDIGINLFVSTLILSLIHHAYNQLYLERILINRGFV